MVVMVPIYGGYGILTVVGETDRLYVIREHHRSVHPGESYVVVEPCLIVEFFVKVDPKDAPCLLVRRSCPPVVVPKDQPDLFPPFGASQTPALRKLMKIANQPNYQITPEGNSRPPKEIQILSVGNFIREPF